MKLSNFLWCMLFLLSMSTQSLFAASLQVEALQFSPGNSKLRNLFNIEDKTLPNIYLLALTTKGGGEYERPQLFHISPQLAEIPHNQRLPLNQTEVLFDKNTESIELFFLHSGVLNTNHSDQLKAITTKEILNLDKQISKELVIPFEAFRSGDRVLFQDFKYDFIVFGHVELEPSQLTKQVEFIADAPYLADYQLQQAVLDGLLKIELSVQN